MRINRRDFMYVSSLAAMGACAPSALAGGIAEAGLVAAPLPITQVRFDLNRIHKWDDSNGDTWDPFWADDDQLYSFNCDGRGFGRQSRNLAFNVFSGSSFESLAGRQVNPMEEYGVADQRAADHATWKVCGQECIDGVFYAFVSRNVYGHESHDPLTRQTALNASLIKSADHGRTWTRTSAQNYAHPMWPGPAFGAPFFVHYGKDGGRVQADRAAEFVYAVSTNGFWCDGDFLVLGRVRRDRIAALDAADWQYWRGGDGAEDRSWTASVYEAAPILARPAKCGQMPVTYIPTLGVYLTISWYNPEPLPHWYNPTEMRYDLYAAAHPWGPWTAAGSLSDSFLAPGSNMYGPSICAKFQEAGEDGVTVRMFTSGCQFEDVPSGIYKAWSMPIVLETRPTPPSAYFSVESAGFEKQGNWQVMGADPGRENLAWTSGVQSDRLTLHFEGTGVEVVSRKAAGRGSLSIAIDGKPEATASLAVVNIPELSGVTVFRRLGFAPGRHILTLANAGGAVNVQGVRLYR
jgi:hypothetical protein